MIPLLFINFLHDNAITRNVRNLLQYFWRSASVKCQRTKFVRFNPVLVSSRIRTLQFLKRICSDHISSSEIFTF